MGFTRQEMLAGVAAARDALTRLAPLIRTDFEAFKMPKKAEELDPPMQAFRDLLDKTDALLARIVAAKDLEEIPYPFDRDAPYREADHWCHFSIKESVLRDQCRPLCNVPVLAFAVIQLLRADNFVRAYNAWHGNKELDEAWSYIGILMRDRTDILVVTGSMICSDGIRARAQAALEAGGATGGWWVSTTSGRPEWKFVRHSVAYFLGYPDDHERPIPPGLYDDLVYDAPRQHLVTTDELGHDMLPAPR